MCVGFADAIPRPSLDTNRYTFRYLSIDLMDYYNHHYVSRDVETCKCRFNFFYDDDIIVCFSEFNNFMNFRNGTA